MCDRRTYKAALVYAALGYAVYPASPYSQAQVSSLGRFPRGDGGFKLATTDVAQVHAWAEHWERPGTNVGVVTGRISRLVVIDVDRRPKYTSAAAGGNGNGSVRFGELVEMDEAPAERVREWARERGLAVPGNVVSTSPSGGLHIWLRLPSHWLDFEVKRRIDWLEKVDLLWDNHSFKVPPSERVTTARKTGGCYRFAGGCPCQVPEASDALVRAMWESPRRSVSQERLAGSSNGYVKQEGADDRVDIAHALEHGIPVGRQHNELYRIACSLAGRGRSPRETLRTLYKITKMSPLGDESDPWTPDDLSTLTESAYMFIREQHGHLAELARKIKT